MAAIKARLETGLHALACCADAAPPAAARHLRDLSPLCLPLLASPVAGAAALDAVRALARCMPPPICGRSLTLAGCLRLVVLAEKGVEGADYSTIPDRAAVADVITALERVRPRAAYGVQRARGAGLAAPQEGTRARCCSACGASVLAALRPAPPGRVGPTRPQALQPTHKTPPNPRPLAPRSRPLRPARR